MDVKAIEKGDYLFKQGDVIADYYYLVKGKRLRERLISVFYIGKV